MSPRQNHVAIQNELLRQRWTVTALTEAVNEHLEQPIARSYLSNIVNGRRNAGFDVVCAIAKVLNVNPYGLLGPEDPKAALRELAAALGATPAELFPPDATAVAS